MVILDGQRYKKKVPFAALKNSCHLKKCGVRTQIQKCNSRVVLRGDIVKDDSGAYAVFTEHGSSASRTTAAGVMHVIVKLPNCDGQAADAKSAYTQVKLEDAPRLLEILKSECPDTWIRLPRHKWPKLWANVEDPVVPLERNVYGHPLAGLLCERIVCLFTEKKDYSFRYTWMTSKCLNTKKCLNHDFLLEHLTKYQDGRNLPQRRMRGPATWKDMLTNALKDAVNWRTKKDRTAPQSLESLLG